jgi:hypothetical protein
MSKTIFFIFAGRQVNMEIQMPYLDRLLDTYPQAELHLWDLTRTPADQKYLNTLVGRHGGRVMVLSHLHKGHPIRCSYPDHARRPRGFPPCACMVHKPPYEAPYKWYAAQPDTDVTYVKLDDDVLFLETDRFDDLLESLTHHPERVVSANVVNNAVCAKYTDDALETANRFSLGDPADWDNNKRWWALHTDPEFALYAHRRFLDRSPLDSDLTSYVRTRPGEAISINCIAFTHQTMIKLSRMMRNDRLGDEGAVDRLLPWICMSFRAAHLTFGPQDAGLPASALDDLRERYTQLSKEYLS